MSSRLTRKEFYEGHFDADKAISTFFALDSDFVHDAFVKPMQRLFTLFSSGDIKGDTVIQFGGSYVIVALLPACELFKDIIIIDFLDSNLQTAAKWLKNEEGAYDWGALAKCLGEMEGGSLNWSQLEETMRGKTKEIIKADLAETHPVAPKLSIQADCLYTALCLELHCANRDAYKKTLKGVASLIKIGGCLIYFALLGCTYFMVGTCKFPVLCVDEEFVKQALMDSGFVIKQCHLNPRVETSQFSVMDFSSTMLFVAYKQCDVQ